MNKYYVLAVIIGILCKLYDDIYDNNLYKDLSISTENIPYFNEILKCSFVLGYAIVTMNYPVFSLIFLSTNLFVYFIKKDDFGPYEIGGCLSAFFMLPFLNWNIHTINIKDFVIFMIILLIPCYNIETITNNNKNPEYSYTKFYARSVAVVFIILGLFLNKKYLFFTESINIWLLCVIGYMATSCIFQYSLLNNLIKAPINEKKIVSEIK